jgi:nucleoside-diphosphate-sugar epimerase
MSHYLLTGTAGFIGSFVAQELLESGHTVTGIDNLNDAYDIRLKHWRLQRLEPHEGFMFHKVDISDAEHLGRVWGNNRYDAVINLAARAGVRYSVENPNVYFQANLIGALNLLNLCRDHSVGKFVQASTSSLYGDHNPTPFNEDTDITKPLSPYAVSKGAAEMLCHSYHHLYGIDVTILRYFTVFGPAGRPDMSIFRFIQWITEDRPVIIYGDGNQERDFTYVEDIARGTILALQPLGYEVLNLGSDRPVKLLDVVRHIEAIVGKSARIEWKETAPADVRATWANIEKAGALLGWEPSFSLEDGLKACVEWYTAERDWAKDVGTTDS